MELARLEILFFFVTMQELCVVRQIHAFLPMVLFLMQVAPDADHLRLQKSSAVWKKQEVYHIHLSWQNKHLLLRQNSVVML